MSRHHTVLGATGVQGGAVVAALLAIGESERAVTRHADSARAEADRRGCRGGRGRPARRDGVAVMTEAPAFDGTRIDIASDNPTPEDMAATLSVALDREVTAVSTDPAGLGSAEMRAMFTYLGDHGYSADTDALHRAYPDIGWQSFADWVRGVGIPR